MSLKYHFKILLLLSVVGAGLDFSASAIELYSFVQFDCKIARGLVIHADQENVFLLSDDGSSKKVLRKGIRQILVYNTLDNPFPSLILTEELTRYLRTVKLVDDKDSVFIGWPIKFFEDKILFFDLDGKTHIVDIEKIDHFELVSNANQLSFEPESIEPATFGVGENLPECKKGVESDTNEIQPSRMLSERIRISRFLKIYEEGFKELTRFQERTFFYSKPFLYEKNTRFALIWNRDDLREELPPLLPFYIQWSSGKSFGAQGIYSIGTKSISILPNAEPVFAFNTEVKSHFLHGSFSGNLFAFSAGSGFMIDFRRSYQEFLKLKDDDSYLLFPHFNYVALTGVGWREYSISGGFFYPIFGLVGKGVFREILSPQSAPIIKFQYETPKWTFKSIFSDIQLSSSKPEKDEISLIYHSEMRQFGSISDKSKALLGQLSNFNFSLRYLRTGFDFQWDPDLLLGVDQLFLIGKYSEILSESSFELGFQQYVTNFHVAQTFSDYLAIKGNLNLFQKNFQAKTSLDSDDSNLQRISLSLAIEFFI